MNVAYNVNSTFVFQVCNLHKNKRKSMEGRLQAFRHYIKSKLNKCVVFFEPLDALCCERKN